MQQVFRSQVTIGLAFFGPKDVTFGYQHYRESFSVWYLSGPNRPQHKYIVVVTGHELAGEWEMVSSIVMPDGFTMFHLLREK